MWQQDAPNVLRSSLEHLDYVEQSMDIFNKSSQSIFVDRICKIRQRLNDPYLYMAVIGEASTGKSTFINALLKQQLLESQVLTMTTKSATTIQYGEQFAVEISYHPITSQKTVPKTIHLTVSDEPISIDGLFGIKNLSLIQLITQITTRDDIAEQLVSLKIMHPTSFLQGGICIIDTPGADVTQLEHLQIAQKSVAQADAAIIITPAKQIVSEALLKMVKDQFQLMPSLHRCIFLITGMDMVRQRERDRLLKVAHQRLKVGLQLEDRQTLPPVLFTSAQAVIDEISKESPIITDGRERQYWRAKFKDLEKELFSRLKQQRTLTISESVLRLLDDLFSALEADLKDQWAQYNAEREALEAAIIPDLEAFAQHQYHECEDCMADVLKQALIWAEAQVSKRRDHLLEKVEEKITQTSSLEALKTFVDQGLPEVLAYQQQKLGKKLSSRFDSIYREAQDIQQRLDQQFTEAYERLSVIQNHNLDSSQWANVSLGADELVTTASGSESLMGVGLQQRVKGAAIAMVVGAVLLPGIGWLVPMVVGSLLGGIFGPSLQERQMQLWQELRPKLVSQFQDVNMDVRQAIRDYAKQLEGAINNQIDENVAQYAQTVQMMREEQQNELARLTELKNTLENVSKELSQRRSRVRSQMKMLNTITL